MDQPESNRRVRRVRHELRVREVEVTGVTHPSPGFASITFGSPELADFTSLSFDDHVKFIFETPEGKTERRDYTPRRFDAARSELTLDFALHGHGPAAEWAREVTVGQKAVIGGPRGSMIIADDHEGYLLVGDASALPAIGRCLDELPASARASVVLLINEEDRRTLTSQAELQLQWVSDAEELLDVLRHRALPLGDIFIWCAGEAHLMSRVREVLIQERGYPAEAMRVAAYWKAATPDFHDRLVG